MKQSLLFVKTQKNDIKDEPSFNAQMLIKAGFIDKTFAGVYTLLPLGLKVIKKIENIIREEIDNIGGQEILMPALHTLDNYEKTGRDKIDVLFYTELHNKKKLVLGQSHEEIVVPLVQKFVKSYRDFPVKVYQFQNKFRNELRAKSGIMRTREFIMKDLYSFHTSEDDLENFYQLVMKAYDNIYKRLELDDKTYFTYASGGTFSKFSHEYQTITDAGEDIIYICDNCKIAINEEIIDVEDKCPKCKNDKLRKEKSVEVANIFKLKNKFTIPFDYKFTDKDGQPKDITMGCYGIGLGRNMGTIVEIHHDENGIIWPKEVTPYKVHLLVLSKDDKLINKANEFYNYLKENNIDTLFDDRIDKGIGQRLADSDLIGIPIRLVISDRTNDKIEYKLRKDDETTLLSKEQVIDEIKKFY